MAGWLVAFTKAETWERIAALRPGRFRGYSVRGATRPGPLVVRQVSCDRCGLIFTEEHSRRWWISTGRWRSLIGFCPECGHEVEFAAGYIPEATP